MSLRNTFMSLAPMCSLLLGLIGLPANAQTNTIISLPSLVAALADGPIQISPAVLPAKAVSAQTAAQAARQAVGIPFDPTQAWPVTITDQEDLSRHLHNSPCWLLPTSKPVQFRSPDRPSRMETIYAVVDVRSGLFREAFTKPRTAWWRRVTPINAALLQSLGGEYGHKAISAIKAPQLPLSGLFHYSGAKQRLQSFAVPSLAARMDQLIARSFLYTDFGFKKLTNTPHGPQYKLHIVRQPVWYISWEGLNMPFVGSVPPPMLGQAMPPLPRTEELNDIINSNTGELYGTLEYRSDLRIDAAR